MKSLAVLLAFASVPLMAGSSDQTSEPSELGCLVDLELPRFAVALRVPDGGHVEARVLLGAGGRAITISLDSTNALLSAEVEHHLREKAVYRADCEGKEIRLEFSFKVEGEKVQCPFAKVRFLPANHFVITTQPVQTTPDRIPVDPPRSKQSKKR